MTTNPTTQPTQSRRGAAYATRSGGNVYAHVGPNGQMRHLDLTAQEAADLAAVLREVLGEEGADR